MLKADLTVYALNVFGSRLSKTRERLSMRDVPYLPCLRTCISHPVRKTGPRASNLLVEYTKSNVFSICIYAFKTKVIRAGLKTCHVILNPISVVYVL